MWQHWGGYLFRPPGPRSFTHTHTASPQYTYSHFVPPPPTTTTPHLPQIGVTELMDRIENQVPTLLVDVRSAEELGVSSIPGALHILAVPDASATYGFKIEGEGGWVPEDGGGVQASGFRRPLCSMGVQNV